MTQPFDRGCTIEAQGAIDHKAGEFWVQNPFDITNQGNNLSAYERNAMYLNMGPGAQFMDVSFASGADIDSDSRSAIVADFDRDGAPDLLVGSAGGGPLRLFRNRFPRTTHRASLRLIGTDSNRSGIGARVEAYTGGRCIVRDVFAANGFMGQSPPELSLGLGDAQQIDKLTVRWPSGAMQVLENLPVDQTLFITEGDSAVEAAQFVARADE